MERTQADLTVQRAIEGRYLPEAREERLAAQAAHKEATRPAPSHVTWDTRPPRPRKPTQPERVIAERADNQRGRWRRDHSDAAATERALRKTRAEVEERWGHKVHATPATMEHATNHRVGALARLHQSGAIDAEQLAAAVDIATEHDRLARDVTPRTASYETRIDGGQRGDGTFFEALGAVQREVAYRAWCSAVAARAPIAAVLAMIVDDPLGYTIVARRWRMSNRRAKALLVDSLDLWWREFAQVRRAVDQPAVDRAHARLV